MEDSSVSRLKPAILMVIDGFGVAPDGPGNAVARAQMPRFRELCRTYPAMTLRASGEEVGLSWGEMGNSEVGHLAIGAGRVYYQTFPRINRDIAAEAFYNNAAFLQAAGHVKQNNSTLHLVGLVSPGNVHASEEHCYALLEFARRQKISDVVVHVIMDGRDTLYNAGIDFVNNLLERMKKLKVGRIGSLSGRFYAMDRDNRWDRVEKAYNAIALGQGETTEDPIAAIKASYTKEVYDEQFVPTVVVKNGAPVGAMKHGDALIFFNFRPDRARELTQAFALPTFDKFPRERIDELLPVTMTEYQQGLPVVVAYPPVIIDKTLAEAVADAGLTQMHIAETEKYAHVTFFLNGTREEPFPREERVLIPSPRVASYDQSPAMSAAAITDRVVEEIRKGQVDVIMMNYANPDMVGHTGNVGATIKACEVIDECIARVVDAVLEQNGVLFLTADHGNGEEVLNVRTGEIDKEHATNPVPFLIVANQYKGIASVAGEVPEGDLSLMPPVGMLADVAPTVLAVLGIPQPPQMTGAPLI